MQLTGDRFTSATASFGNDRRPCPTSRRDPRASRDTARCLGFPDPLRRSRHHDPGDKPDVLVAMNPAALKANIGDLDRGGTVIVNTDEFTKRAVAKVGYDTDPLTDGSLDSFSVHPIPSRR